MKELEKLAHEACRDPAVQISDSLYQDGFSDGFEAGFRTAREMAMVILKDNQYMAPGLYEPLIEQLGEIQVGE